MAVLLSASYKSPSHRTPVTFCRFSLFRYVKRPQKGLITTKNMGVNYYNERGRADVLEGTECNKVSVDEEKGKKVVYLSFPKKYERVKYCKGEKIIYININYSSLSDS